MKPCESGVAAEWLAARLELLKAEKGANPAQRRAGAGGGRSCRGFGSRGITDSRLTRGTPRWQDLFRGRSQLLVYHFMFGPDYKAGCATCSTIADGFKRLRRPSGQPRRHAFRPVSRAPLAKLQTYKRRMGWSFPWASSVGGDFNFDFNVSFTEEQQREGPSNTTTSAAATRWMRRRSRSLSP